MFITISNIFKELRIDHYIKNLVVFIPFFLGRSFNNIDILHLFQSFALFCSASSTVYLFNDIMDYKDDRLNPFKKHRPYASDLLSKKQIFELISFTFSLSIIFCINLPLICLILILSYYMINICYSLKVKKIFLLDAIFISAGFIIRVLIGCIVLNIIPNFLLILFIFISSNFFTHIKRKVSLKYSNKKHRILLKCIYVEFYLIIVLYGYGIYRLFYIYNMSPLLLGLNFISFSLALYRILYLSDNVKTETPLDFMKRDKLMKIYMVIYFLSLILM